MENGDSFLSYPTSEKTWKVTDESAISPNRAYDGEDIILKLPKGTTWKDFKWFAVYCRQFDVSFGSINFTSS